MLLSISHNPHTKNPKELHQKLIQEKNRKIGYNNDKEEIAKLRRAFSNSKRIKVL